MKAKEDLASTIRNAESNNKMVGAWNRIIEARIDQALNIKRTDLIHKYGW